MMNNILDLPGSGERRYLQIAKNLAEQIDSGTYAMGTKLPPERELAASLEVSRTTVREALLALELMRYVEIRLGSGVFVLPKSDRQSSEAESVLADEVGPFEIVEMRRVLEGGVAAKAAERISDKQLVRLTQCHEQMASCVDDIAGFDRADREFHALIAEASGNSLMERYVRELWQMRGGALWPRWYDQTRSRTNRLHSVADHERILTALRRRLPDVAGTAMQAHIDILADRFFELDLDPDDEVHNTNPIKKDSRQ